MHQLLCKAKILSALILVIFSSNLAYADPASDVDRNIQIIFPPDIMQETLAATTPELLGNLKYSNDADKTKTASAVDQFHQEFLQKFNALVTQSLKESFTPDELQQWAQFQTTPLGEKTMTWMKTKYPGILNKAMDAPMQDLYKNLGQ